MYRRPKFLEILIDIRLEMAREADYDVDLFIETAKHATPVSSTVAETPAQQQIRVEERDPLLK